MDLLVFAAPTLVIIGFTMLIAIIKIAPNDKFNAKISDNLKEYEKDINDKYKL